MFLIYDKNDLIPEEYRRNVLLEFQVQSKFIKLKERLKGLDGKVVNISPNKMGVMSVSEIK